MSYGTDKEWLAGLKAGDPVAVRDVGWGVSYDLRTVDRATKTFVVVGFRKYRRKDGHEVGRDYSRQSIVPVSQEVRDAIELDGLRREYRGLHKSLDVKVDWKEAPELRVAIKALKAAVKAFERADAADAATV